MLDGKVSIQLYAYNILLKAIPTPLIFIVLLTSTKHMK